YDGVGGGKSSAPLVIGGAEGRWTTGAGRGSWPAHETAAPSEATTDARASAFRMLVIVRTRRPFDLGFGRSFSRLSRHLVLSLSRRADVVGAPVSSPTAVGPIPSTDR